jgi:hypothetical protein
MNLNKLCTEADLLIFIIITALASHAYQKFEGKEALKDLSGTSSHALLVQCSEL